MSLTLLDFLSFVNIVNDLLLIIPSFLYHVTTVSLAFRVLLMLLMIINVTIIGFTYHSEFC